MKALIFATRVCRGVSDLALPPPGISSKDPGLKATATKTMENIPIDEGIEEESEEMVDEDILALPDDGRKSFC
jgi:hypothetical protein